MALSNDIAALIGVVCEGVLWGVNATLFLHCIATLTWRRHTNHHHWMIVVATCVLFVFCTTHFGLEFNHFYTTLRAIGVENFSDETHQLFGADLLIPTIDFLGDMVLLYRCWLIWGGNYYVIILPTLTALAGFACAIGSLGLFLHVSPNAQVPPSSIVPLGVAGYALPLVTNFCITSLIVGRIYYASRFTRGVNTEHRGLLSNPVTHIREAASIIVESGMLYLVTQLIFVVLFGMGHPAEAIMAVVAVQVYGIAPTLIFLRVGLGIGAENMTRKTTGIGLEDLSEGGHRQGLDCSTEGVATAAGRGADLESASIIDAKAD